ncbi:hypothetical protein ACFV7Q_37670 [Streptomyces sp. NPDC059851]|uniref:hypothetical protein n=1 Tax=Streptomyces sp. NPDC059851 TaxID=3346971 RepID=UPI00366123EC
MRSEAEAVVWTAVWTAVWILFLGASAVLLRRHWRGAGIASRPDVDWVSWSLPPGVSAGRALRQGINRALPVILGGAWVIALGVGVRWALPVLGVELSAAAGIGIPAAALALTAFGAVVLVPAVVLFNRPRLLVAPPLRGEPGLLAQWRSDRRMRAGNTGPRSVRPAERAPRGVIATWLLAMAAFVTLSSLYAADWWRTAALHWPGGGHAFAACLGLAVPVLAVGAMLAAGRAASASGLRAVPRWLLTGAVASPLAVALILAFHTMPGRREATRGCRDRCWIRYTYPHAVAWQVTGFVVGLALTGLLVFALLRLRARRSPAPS